MTATARNTDTLPEGFLETPLAQALCAAANEGKEVTIDEAIDVVVEYGRTRQNAFESDAQVEFFHKHPAFISIPATRVVGRSPTFTEVFEKLSGTEEELTHFRNKVVTDLVARGDMRPSAEEVVDEDTGEVIDSSLETVGTIEITEAKEKIAYGKPLKGGKKIAKGMSAFPAR